MGSAMKQIETVKSAVKTFDGTIESSDGQQFQAPMAAKETQSSEISQFVDKMVEKGAKTAQTEQQAHRFQDLAIKSRKKAKMLHSGRQSDPQSWVRPQKELDREQRPCKVL